MSRCSSRGKRSPSGASLPVIICEVFNFNTNTDVFQVRFGIKGKDPLIGSYPFSVKNLNTNEVTEFVYTQSFGSYQYFDQSTLDGGPYELTIHDDTAMPVRFKVGPVKTATKSWAVDFTFSNYRFETYTDLYSGMPMTRVSIDVATAIPLQADLSHYFYVQYQHPDYGYMTTTLPYFNLQKGSQYFSLSGIELYPDVEYTILSYSKTGFKFTFNNNVFRTPSDAEIRDMPLHYAAFEDQTAIAQFRIMPPSPDEQATLNSDLTINGKISAYVNGILEYENFSAVLFSRSYYCEYVSGLQYDLGSNISITIDSITPNNPVGGTPYLEPDFTQETLWNVIPQKVVTISQPM